MQGSIVIIPTYNEVENIAAILRAVFSQSEAVHVLVVDDNSPDGTAQQVQSLQKTYPQRLFLEERSQKSGLGTAYIHGFKWCLARSYEYVFEMDADFSHDPKDLKRLYAACKTAGADLAIGSRYVNGVNVVNWPIGRVVLSYLASKYVRLITGMKVHDTTAGFVCYRRQVLETLDLDQISFIGYAFQIEMKFKTYLNKFRVVEIPVIFTDRVRGESKLTSGIISEAIFGVISMKLKSIINPSKATQS